jgi:hypothetical protein
VWVMREFTDGSYVRCLDRLNEQRTLANAKHTLLATSVRTENDSQVTTVYIHLSDPLLRSTYPDFVDMDAGRVPKEARLIYGDEHSFRQSRGSHRPISKYCRWK